MNIIIICNVNTSCFVNKQQGIRIIYVTFIVINDIQQVNENKGIYVFITIY